MFSIVEQRCQRKTDGTLRKFAAAGDHRRTTTTIDSRSLQGLFKVSSKSKVKHSFIGRKSTFSDRLFLISEVNHLVNLAVCHPLGFFLQQSVDLTHVAFVELLMFILSCLSSTVFLTITCKVLPTCPPLLIQQLICLIQLSSTICQSDDLKCRFVASSNEHLCLMFIASVIN